MYLQFPLSVQLDGSGNGTAFLPLPPGQWVSFTLQLANQGAASQVEIVQNGQILMAGIGNLVTIGPITAPAQQGAIQVNVSGGTPNATATGSIQGDQAATYSQLLPQSGLSNSGVVVTEGSVTISGPVDISGPVTVEQQNPSLLLTGGAGYPLIDNAIFSVPAHGTNQILTNQSISGYPSLLMLAKATAGGNNVLWAEYQWEDALNTAFAYTTLGSIFPYCFAVIGAISPNVSLNLNNTDGVNHSVTMSLIPLTQTPTELSSLIPNITAGQTLPDRRQMITVNTLAVPGNSTITETALFVWVGEAILTIWSSADNWSANVLATDATGAVVSIARMGSTLSQGVSQLISLPGAIVSVAFTNNASSASNTNISLIATG